jgi:hypothetical protein
MAEGKLWQLTFVPVEHVFDPGNADMATRKSVVLLPGTYGLLSRIRAELRLKFSNMVSQDRVIDGSEFHVELVSDASRTETKRINYDIYHQSIYNLASACRWGFIGNAFCLILGPSIGPLGYVIAENKMLHITLVHFHAKLELEKEDIALQCRNVVGYAIGCNLKMLSLPWQSDVFF